MPVTLIATPADAAANTYCTVVEADTYHESRLYVDTWTGAALDDKNRALVMATRLLDELYEWYGYPTTTTQALQWPRNSVLDHLQWSYIDSMTLPPRLKEATAEYARQLLDGDRTADNQVEAQGLSSLTAGPISLSFKESFEIKVIPDAVLAMIYPWWGHARGSGIFRELARA